MAKPSDCDIPLAFLRECLTYDHERKVARWTERPRRHFNSDHDCHGTKPTPTPNAKRR
jgi:hypothetical protein